MRYFIKISEVLNPDNVFSKYKREARYNRFTLDPLDLKTSASKFLNDYNKYRHLSYTKIKTELEKKNYDDPLKYTPALAAIRVIHKKKVPEQYNHVIDDELNSYIKKLQNVSHKESKDQLMSGLVLPIGAIAGSLGLAGVMSKTIKDTDEKNINKLYSKLKDSGQINPKTSLSFADSALDSYFDPSKNKVYTGKDLSVAAHEFGHAENQAKAIRTLGEKPGKVFKTVQYMEAGQIPYIGLAIHRVSPVLARIPLLGLAAVPFATKPVSKFIQGDEGKGFRHSVGKTMYEHPELVVGAGVSPKLWEEASASIKGIKNIIKYIEPGGDKLKTVLSHSKKLGPAFGTYMLAAGIPVAAAAYLGKSRRRVEKLNKEIKI